LVNYVPIFIFSRCWGQSLPNSLHFQHQTFLHRSHEFNLFFLLQNHFKHLNDLFLIHLKQFHLLYQFEYLYYRLEPHSEILVKLPDHLQNLVLIVDLDYSVQYFMFKIVCFTIFPFQKYFNFRVDFFILQSFRPSYQIKINHLFTLEALHLSHEEQ
jgi:hypothetical protein